MYLGNQAKLEMIAKAYVTLWWRLGMASAMAFFPLWPELSSCGPSVYADCAGAAAQV